MSQDRCSPFSSGGIPERNEIDFITRLIGFDIGIELEIQLIDPRKKHGWILTIVK
ncbi:hypothetical protein [Peribacillus simplex]|uniref:hypothetical protein n=1 Tax=Peribacillus simplex TaxID=1478 RepID=UPI0016293A7A|nr:hypothetical protein [Peribacillus simplex]